MNQQNARITWSGPLGPKSLVNRNLSKSVVMAPQASTAQGAHPLMTATISNKTACFSAYDALY